MKRNFRRKNVEHKYSCLQYKLLIHLMTRTTTVNKTRRRPDGT